MPFLTPDSVPSDTICRTLVIPNDPTWIAIVNGALSVLMFPYNFQQFGSVTPEDVAYRFGEMWDAYRESECELPAIIGEVRMFAMTAVPDKWLVCSGLAISRTTYADLFAAIGTNFGAGNGTTTFNVPNLSNRFPKGYSPLAAAGTEDAIGGTGGAASVTLDVTQIPAHTHAERVQPNTGGSTNRIIASTASGAVQDSALVTGSTGGGAAHENRPPFLSMVYAIYVGVTIV